MKDREIDSIAMLVQTIVGLPLILLASQLAPTAPSLLSWQTLLLGLELIVILQGSVWLSEWVAKSRKRRQPSSAPATRVEGSNNAPPLDR